MRKNIPYVIIILLIISQVISYFKISQLERRVEQTSNNIWDLRDNVDNRINAIYNNVDKKLDEQASYIEHVETTIGSPNVDDLTVPITYTITPKEVSDRTAISLDINGEVLPMARNGTVYSLTVASNIFGEVYPYILILEDDITKTEKNNQLCLNIKNELFPELFIRFSGSAGGSSKQYKLDGRIGSDIKPSSLSSPIEYIDAKLVIKVDNVVISDKSVDIKSLDGYKVKEEISLNDGETCTATIIVKDNIGLEHHYLINTYVQGAKRQREPFFGDEKIYSSDGTLLWSK